MRKCLIYTVNVTPAGRIGTNSQTSYLYKASFESSYVKNVSDWERKQGRPYFTVVIPPNATVKIVLPANSVDKVTLGCLPLTGSRIRELPVQDGRIVNPVPKLYICKAFQAKPVDPKLPF